MRSRYVEGDLVGWQGHNWRVTAVVDIPEAHPTSFTKYVKAGKNPALGGCLRCSRKPDYIRIKKSGISIQFTGYCQKHLPPSAPESLRINKDKA